MSHNSQTGACADYQSIAHQVGKRTSLKKNEGGNEHVCGRVRGPSLACHFGGMVLWATILFLQGAGFVGKSQ